MQLEKVMQYIPESRKRSEKACREYPGAENFEVEHKAVGGVECVWVKVPDASSKSIMIHLHGGSYFQCSAKSHATFVSQIASRAKVNSVVVEYGLAPENPFPQGLNDTLKVYQGLLETGQYDHIILVGDSSGGGLALALTEKLRQLNLPLPVAIVGLYPWIDLRDEACDIALKSIGEGDDDVALWIALVNLYCNGESKENPLISPIFLHLKDFPPMLVQVGEKDFLLPQGKIFVEKARKDGMEIELEIYKDMEHGWHVFAPDAPEGAEAYDNIAKFVKKHV